MNRYDTLAEKALSKRCIDDEDISKILTNQEVELLPLLQCSYKVRSRFFGNRVRIHILNNIKSGNCQEDCSYCAQSGKSKNTIEKYPVKTREEILTDAQKTFESGISRYCMVFSGRGLTEADVDFVCSVVREIRDKFKMEICISAGFLTEEKARKLTEAGVSRYNHNLNTGKDIYPDICRTHSYQMRYDTLKLAKSAGLEICSGLILGLGETIEDIVSIIHDLRSVKVKSLPVNFFIPVEGHRIKNVQSLDPRYCLKVLSVFRLSFPDTEIRCAGGREYHLRGLQSLCLYPVNSIFANGYLTEGGDPIEATKKMILDAGFSVDGIEY